MFNSNILWTVLSNNGKYQLHTCPVFGRFLSPIASSAISLGSSKCLRRPRRCLPGYMNSTKHISTSARWWSFVSHYFVHQTLYFPYMIHPELRLYCYHFKIIWEMMSGNPNESCCVVTGKIRYRSNVYHRRTIFFRDRPPYLADDVGMSICVDRKEQRRLHSSSQSCVVRSDIFSFMG